MIALVTLKFPPVKILVDRDVQFANGDDTLVLDKTSNCCPAEPLVPLMIRFVPEVRTFVIYGCEVTGADTTVKVPSNAKWFVKTTPGGGTIVRVSPLFNGWLNKANVWPATSAGPTLLKVTVPAPILFNAPLTATMSLDCAMDVFTVNVKLPLTVKSPLMVSVPTGDSVPSACIEPLTEPLPVRVWLDPRSKNVWLTLNVAFEAMMISAEFGMAPEGPNASVPALMVVLPSWLKVLLRVNVPLPILAKATEPAETGPPTMVPNCRVSVVLLLPNVNVPIVPGAEFIT